MDIIGAIKKNPVLKEKVIAAGSEMFAGFIKKHGVENIKWGIVRDSLLGLGEGDKVVVVIECEKPDGLVQAIRDTVNSVKELKDG